MTLSVSQISQARRTDVLLRARYPQLVTRLFEITSNNFVIAFNAELMQAREIAEHFDHNIRPATLAITLANSSPETFLREIIPIADADVAKGLEGFSFTQADLTTILASRYPHLPLLNKVGVESDRRLMLFFESALDASGTRIVEEILAGALPGWPISIAVGKQVTRHPETAPAPHDAIQIRAAKLRPAAPGLVTADQNFFWGNLDGVFEGRIPPHDFPGMQGLGAACFVDASTLPQIDLRQLLLLYDTIILSPPVDLGFWRSQHLTREEVLRIIEAGRLRLLLRLPEERTDPRLLAAAYERRSDAVIGRLTSAAIFAADLVSTANEYALGRPEHRSQVVQLAKLLAADIGVAEREVIDFLLWPVGARLGCLHPLLDRGLMGVGAIGLGRGIGERIKETIGKDLRLEALSAADGVHIAHALGATFIPSPAEMDRLSAARQLVGRRLNFYRSLNNRVAAAWAINERRKEEHRLVLPPLPLFAITKHASIKDIIDFTSRASTRFAGRGLVSRLFDLSPEDRSVEIDRLEKELYALNVRRDRRNLVLDTTSDGGDIANDLLEDAIPSLIPGIKLIAKLIGLARRNCAFDTIADIIERDIAGRMGRNADLQFLAKVNRVAQIRDPHDGLMPNI